MSKFGNKEAAWFAIGCALLLVGATPSFSHAINPNAANTRLTELKQSLRAAQTRLDQVQQRSVVRKMTPSVTLVAPNGGEALTAGQTYTIAWRSIGLAGKTFALYYNKSDNARSLIATGVTGNSYDWVVPNVLAGTFVVGIEVVGMDTIFDWSDGKFNIQPGASPGSTPPPAEVPSGAGISQPPPSVTFTANGIAGNQTVARGTPITFAWASANATACFTNFAPASIATAGAYTMEVTKTGTYGVSCYDGYGHQATKSLHISIAEQPLAVSASLTVRAPNGGEKFEKGKTYPITWESAGVSTVEIKLLNAATLGEFRFEQYGFQRFIPAASGSYSWTVPESLPEANYIVAVVSSDDSSVADRSDAPFAVVVPAPAVSPASTLNEAIAVYVRVNGATETMVPPGEKVKFSWASSAPAARCEGSGLLAGKNIGTGTSGQYELAVTESGEYSVTCYDAQNRRNASSVTVRVAATQQSPAAVALQGAAATGNQLPRITHATTNTPAPFRAKSAVEWVVVAEDAEDINLSYTADWGDGTPVERIAGGGGTAPGKPSFAEFRHTYSAEGRYTITFTATDGKGGVARDIKQITVTSAADAPVSSGGSSPLSLASAVVENGTLKLTYTKQFENPCAQLSPENSFEVIGQNWCKSGSNVSDVQYAVGYSLKPGARVRLCNAHDRNVCSAAVPLKIEHRVLLTVNGKTGSTSIPAGTSATLAWDNLNMVPGTCSLSGGAAFPAGNAGTTGSVVTGALETSKTFTLSCVPQGGGVALFSSVAITTTGIAPSTAARTITVDNPGSLSISGQGQVATVAFRTTGSITKVTWELCERANDAASCRVMASDIAVTGSGGSIYWWPKANEWYVGKALWVKISDMQSSATGSAGPFYIFGQ